MPGSPSKSLLPVTSRAPAATAPRRPPAPTSARAVHPAGVLRMRTASHGNLLAASAAASLHASAAPSPPLSRKGSWLDVRVHAAAGASPGGGEAAGPPPAAAAALASLTPVLAVVGVASLGAFAFGYHLAVVNGPLDAMAASLGFAGDSAKQGLVVSTLLAGAAAGSLAGSAAADALGRRGGLVATAAPLALGAAACATAAGLPSLLLGRALAGLGIGLASALVPLYISEVAPARVRGALGSVNQLVICVGILGALLANVALPATAWRSMFGVAAVPAVLLAAGMALAPESPRWLASRGEAGAADAAARMLWGPAGPAELAAAAAAPKAGAAPPARLSAKELASSRGVLTGCALFALQQFAGINAIVYFSSSVFAKAGITNGAAASAAVGAVNVAGSALAAALMDKAGRLTLLTASFGGMAAAMLLMAAGLGLPQFAAASAPIALGGTLAYVLAFALGAGPVPGLLVPEIAPARLRGAAVSLAMTTHWVCNFAVGQAFLPVVSSIGVAGAYLGFAGVCLAALAFARAAVPETKGKSLEEIERLMAA